MNGGGESFFLPYQRKWILDDSRIKIMEKSRQIGLSWSTAYDLVRRHAATANGGKALDSWVSSRDEMQASLFISDCKKFADILGLAAREISGGGISDDARSNSKILAFENGTRINSLSSNADAQAGKRGSRVLDEFALHPDPMKLYAIAYPGITWGGSLQIISTHRGSMNFFNTLLEEAKHKGNPKKISLHRVTLQDALEQGFLKKLKRALPAGHEVSDMDEAAYFDRIKNSCADMESFMQEYMCVPFDDQSAFIPSDDIQKCLYPPDCEWRKSISHARAEDSFYLGIDVGRSRDLSVFWLLEKSDGMLFTRDVIVFKDTPFSEQEAALYELLKHPALRRAAIDQTGLGRQFAERAIERFGSTRIEGVNFTSSTKEALAYPLRSAFESCALKIPDDIQIRADLRSIKRQASASGGIRFSADRSESGHADRFWALALALRAAKENLAQPRIDMIRKEGVRRLW